MACSATRPSDGRYCLVTLCVKYERTLCYLHRERSAALLEKEGEVPRSARHREVGFEEGT
jgi:hypothetical protein